MNPNWKTLVWDSVILGKGKVSEEKEQKVCSVPNHCAGFSAPTSFLPTALAGGNAGTGRDVSSQQAKALHFPGSRQPQVLLQQKMLYSCPDKE